MIIKVVAKALLINDKDEVLLLRRSLTDDRRPGEMDFPGGGIDDGEDITAGVKREILEEAGVDIPLQDLHVLYAGTQIVGGDSVTRLLYWTRVYDPEIHVSFEHSEFTWVPIDDATALFPHPFYSVGLRYGLQNAIFRQ